MLRFWFGPRRQLSPQHSLLVLLLMIAFSAPSALLTQLDAPRPVDAPAAAPAAEAGYDARNGLRGTPAAPHAEESLPLATPLLFAATVGGAIVLFGVVGAWALWPRERPVVTSSGIQLDDGVDEALREG